MKSKLGAECGIHGPAWSRVHGGYFSDPAVAKPLVEAIRDTARTSKPDVIVDLGGGTGFLLSQVRSAGIGPDTALVNLDCSPAQLGVAEAAGVSTVRGSVDDFHRADVVPAGRKALFLMRSVLHYAGEAGLMPLLRHLRAQAKEGEYWIHQTACFAGKKDADCLNALYRRMRTEKWYPTVADLESRLAAAGWQVEAVFPAPTLGLESEELGRRYGLDGPALQRIGSEMTAEYGGQNEVFHLRPVGFHAELHYGIIRCRASS
jgi:SAM-dependent methyltransferase